MTRKITARKLASRIEKFTRLVLDTGGYSRRNKQLEGEARELIDILSDPNRTIDDHQLAADRWSQARSGYRPRINIGTFAPASWILKNPPKPDLFIPWRKGKPVAYQIVEPD